MNPNKIYILETTVDDKPVYKQYKIKDGQWVLIGDIAPTVSLDGYLKTKDADLLYQKKGSYVTQNDLLPYALTTTVQDLSLDLQNYARVEYVVNSLQ